MGRSLLRLLEDGNGAVVPTVALSLAALTAIGGIAFDYARVASMDTEVQSAADQAALAAASQLDGQSGACARAAAAASSLLSNKTLFANESGSNRAVVVTNEGDCDATGDIRFYQSWNQGDDTPGEEATTDAEAKVVLVAVNSREAVFALTPIVAAIRSGSIEAEAVASLSSAICKMPPVMICNPAEGSGTTFNPADFVGKGLRLTSVGNGSGSWAPGNFGYLDTQTGVNGAPDLRQGLGWAVPAGECAPTTGVDTKPGANVNVTDALNTRFDIYDSNVSCPTGGSCPSSINSVKDVVRAGNASGNNACKIHNQGWHFDTSGTGYYGQNVPTTAAALPSTTTPSSMGYPRDLCHAISQAGNCTNGRIGNASWDRDAYFRVNYRRSGSPAFWTAGSGTTAHSWQANTGLPSNATRYQVYSWEIAHRGQAIDGVTILGPRTTSGSGASANKSYGSPQCSPSQGYGSGQVPDSRTPDRRRISVAVVNCTAENVHGNSTEVSVEKWIEVFLVEPSLARQRTNAGDIYVEVIGETPTGGGGGTGGQVIRHDVPYLIK
jgi:hypothetical protein